MSVETVKILETTNPERRVLIVRRGDGHYGLVAERWYRNVWEGRLIKEGWIPTGRPSSIFATAEIAEREARGKFPELAPK
jgi:hypothetical protein